MKITITKSNLFDVLANIQGLTGRKTNLAITSNVLLQTDGDRIKLTATDLETGFQGSYPANIQTEGTLALNARKLYEIVRDFPSDEILINEVESGWIQIGHDGIEYHLVGMDPQEFPAIPSIEDAQWIPIEAMAFKKMIERNVFITGASDDRRAHIVGSFLECISDQSSQILRLVATDGSRLAKVDYRYEQTDQLPIEDKILIPKKGLQEVNKFIDPAVEVRIARQKNNFIVQMGHETLIIRLLEGDFPSYHDILTKEGATTIKIDRQAFLMVLKRMSILATDTYRSVLFQFKSDNLKISSTNPDLGESKEEMTIAYKGPELEMAFNPKYFIDALNVIDDDNVTVYLFDEERPFLVEGETDSSLINVIMPMRI
jgi:DNA polymerase-3 subunit beta